MTYTAQHIKEDFTEWMRPNLREYYRSRIGYLRGVIEEMIPDRINEDFARIALGETGNELPLDLFDSAMYQPMREYMKYSGKLIIGNETSAIAHAIAPCEVRERTTASIAENIAATSRAR